MTTTPPSAAKGDDSGAVAVEWIASTTAAIGLLLCFLAAPVGEWATKAPVGQRVESPR